MNLLVLLLLNISQIPPTEDAEFEALRPLLVEYDLPDAFDHGGTAASPSYNLAGSLDLVGHANGEFPWVNPLGTDYCGPHVFTRTFRYFPKDKKIRVWRKRSYFQNEVASWQWVFPVDTVFVEVFYQKFEGKDWPWLILSVTKDEHDDWVPAAYMPILEMSELAYYGLKPTKTYRLVLHDATHPFPDVHSKKSVEELPPIPAPLVKVLLSKPFRRQDSYFTDTTWIPTSAQEFSLVPKDFLGGAVDLDTESCTQCHRSAGRHAKEMDAGRDWYGNREGSDRRLSWHPFDASCISYNGFKKPVVFRRNVLPLLRFD